MTTHPGDEGMSPREAVARALRKKMRDLPLLRSITGLLLPAEIDAIADAVLSALGLSDGRCAVVPVEVVAALELVQRGLKRGKIRDVSIIEPVPPGATEADISSLSEIIDRAMLKSINQEDRNGG